MTSHDFASFGALLQAFRKRGHLTQHQLAQALGVYRSTISRWEAGSYLPESKAVVLELARHLKLDDQETRQLLEASLTALAPYWSVPLLRNPYFTGREEVLSALHAQLGIDQAVALTQSAALHGLGGVGKTQIALEYAYRHALEYRAVFWIGAGTEDQIVSSLLRIAEALGLPERDDKDQRRVVAAVQRWLSAHSQWLVIWDNVEDLELLQRFLPVSRSGTILITTRSQTLSTLARGIDLVPMEQEEGMLFLLRRAKVLEPQAQSQQMRQFAEQMPQQYAAAAELVRVLGGLPLALDQAGAYVEETRCGLSAYLDLFHSRRADLLRQRGEGARDHPTSVSTTLTLSIVATAQRHPAVEDLLRVCALLQADAIPEELFRQGSEHLGAPLAAVCRDPLEWDRLVGVACSYSLLSRQPEERTLSMHRLVQAVLLDSMTDEERERWKRLASEALDAVFPEIFPYTEYTAWKSCERLLPHALACLHCEATTHESLVVASLAYKAAQYLRERGRYAEGEALFLRSVQLREQVLGSDHPDVGTSLNYLALLYWRQGRYTEAETLLQRALHIWEQASGPDHLDVARPLNNLALICLEQARYEEAEPLLQRALHIWEQASGPDSPCIAHALYNLAQLYQYQGKYEEVEPLLERVLSMRERVLGPEHPEVAYALVSRAKLYIEQARYEEAEALSQRALHLREQALEPDHPLMASPLNCLALISVKQHKHEQAESFFQRALYIWEQAAEPEHPDVVHALNGLAELSVEQGRYEPAEQFYQRAVRINRQRRGLEHPETAHSLNGLANLCRVQDKDAEAEYLFQRALSIREHRLGPQHPQTADTFHGLALLRQKQGHLDEAISLAERARSIRLQALGEGHPQTAATRTLYAQLIQGQADGAEPTVEHIRTLLKARGWSLHLKQRRGKSYVYATRKVGGHTHSRYLAPLSNLAACLAAAGTLPNAREG